MSLQPTVRRLLSLALCLCAGCALSPGAKKSADVLGAGQNSTGGGASGSATSTPSTPNDRGQGTAQSGATPQSVSGSTPNSSRAANGAASSAPDSRVIDDVLGELAALGQVQPEAQKRLIEDLRKTDPAYWPLLVQTFRASLEYRRRSAQKAVEEPPSAAAVRRDGQPEIVQVAAHEPLKESVSEPSDPARKAIEVAPPASPATAGSAAAPGQSLDTKKAQAATSAGPAPTGNAAPGAWRHHLEAAIAELERQTRERPGDTDALANQVYLRLLDLAAGRRDDALKPIAGLPPGQQDYWAKQLFALSTYLDPSAGDPGRRAAEASLHLARAVASLGELGPLVVRNLTFCTHVHSYGVLERFEPAEFRAEQQVLLYAELENFKSEETAQGFHTSLEGRYQILDRQGQRVAHDELSTTEEHCQNRRRDFFVAYFIKLPKNIYEGSYTLDLTVEDKLGRKIGQSSIDFIVKQK